MSRTEKDQREVRKERWGRGRKSTPLTKPRGERGGKRSIEQVLEEEGALETAPFRGE